MLTRVFYKYYSKSACLLVLALTEISYHISQINTASSSPVLFKYKMVVIFYQQYTLEQYHMPLRNSGFYSKLSCNNGSFIDHIRVIMSSCKERGKMYSYIVGNIKQVARQTCAQVYISKESLTQPNFILHSSTDCHLQYITSVMTTRD